MQPLVLGPDSGEIAIHTTVEGSASRFGHNLKIVVSQWSADINFEADIPVSVRVTADMAALEISRSSGGVSPISSVDKKLIRRNAVKALRVDNNPVARYDCERVEPTETGYQLFGQLEISGTERPQTIPLTVTAVSGGYALAAEFPVQQTSFDVKPYAAMLGTMKVGDNVRVTFSATVAALPDA
ncbi:MAG: YceI family protein [Actinomycetia bacterium]|nr:YceI family protein [Actinomycetes bacterium]